VGNISGLDHDRYTIFFMNSTEEPEQVPNDAIVPVADAIAAAREFFVKTELPPSIEWFEL
jgi:hypothetical protein